VETAKRQALQKKSSLARELRVLTLHGYLHLLGFDHAKDNGEMRKLEYRLRRLLGITQPTRKTSSASRTKQRPRKKK
jgi:probable rRNA maturation factor